MDERLEKALDISNIMVTINNKKRLMQEKYQENLVHYHNGGQFTITQQLISFCSSLLQLEQDSTIIVDDNKVPVDIENLKEFTDAVVTKYFEASNSYLVEYNELKQTRSVESIMDL